MRDLLHQTFQDRDAVILIGQVLRLPSFRPTALVRLAKRATTSFLLLVLLAHTSDPETRIILLSLHRAPEDYSK